MSKIKDLNIFQRLLLELLWGFCWLVGHMPHYVQFHILARGVKLIMYHLLRYRLYVVNRNLNIAFPDWDKSQRKAFASKFYTYLSETIVSTFTLSNKRCALGVIGLDETTENGVRGDLFVLREEYANRSWIALTAHYGIWEYLLFWSDFSGQNLVAVYHPLQNKVFNELFKRLRGYDGVMPMSPKESLLFTIRNKEQYEGRSYVVGLIADQNPPNLPTSKWFDFLGRETIFFDGGEIMARRSKLPVIFLHQKRTARGRYQIHRELIWDGKEEIEEGEIIRRYVKLLERGILEEPSLWLWTHKRWKHTQKLTK